MTALDEGWILDCVSGAAPEAVRVLAACHASLNPLAARRFEAAEAAMGAILTSQTGSNISSGLRESTLLAAKTLTDPQHAAADRDGPETPGPESIMKRVSGNDWTRRLGGFGEIVLNELNEPGVHARLLAFPPGKGVPEHDHEAAELTLVLSGSFDDGLARYRRGDVCLAEPGKVHRPSVDSNRTCICFAVELGSWRPTNPVYALIKQCLPRRGV